ncbi:MAG: antitoxin [Methyloprofundus sp.]|nr:MAG: antitoxin [Methyloprofundus sp.]
MTTIELDDKLINKVIKIGHYQNAQKAIDTILSDYIQTHQKQNTSFDKLCFELEMTDEEIDSLFKRDKDAGRTLDL